MLPTSQKINGKSNTYIEIQNKLREQLEKLEIRYEERLEKLRKVNTISVEMLHSLIMLQLLSLAVFEVNMVVLS